MEKTINKLISTGCGLYVASIPSINDFIINLLYKTFNININIPKCNLCFIFGTICFIIAVLFAIKFYKKNKIIALLGLDNSNKINKMSDMIPINIISEIKELNSTNSRKIIKKYIEKIEETKKDYGYQDLSYYGIMPLPFVAIAGLLFRKMDIKNHYEYWQKDGKIKRLSLLPYYLCSKLIINEKIGKNKIALLSISLTSQINSDDLTQFKACNYYSVKINNSRTNAIHSEEQLDYYAEKIATLIYKISKTPIQKIYIVASCQSSLMFEVFKRINVNRVPKIIVCNYSKNSKFKYNWGISVENNIFQYIEMGEIDGRNKC